MIAEELYPKIVVFHNALANPLTFLDSIKEGSPFVKNWQKWYDLGTQTFFTEYPEVVTTNFPTDDLWKERWVGISNPVAREAGDVFYACTKIYHDTYRPEMPEWRAPAPFILSHDSKLMNGHLAMQYHTDFQIARTNMPGFKFWITALLYVNDDYEGGEIAFKIFKDAAQMSRNAEFDRLRYKPKAGDMLVIPAHHPYWHGVCKTTTNQKVFLRMFWGYRSLGSPEWLENEKLHEPGAWAAMEEKRAAKEVDSGEVFMGTVEETVNGNEIS